MSNPQKVNWKGRSGATYSYSAFPIGTNFKSFAGNYIFAKHVSSGIHPIYIGQSEDVPDRLRNHEKKVCASHNGATHIHVKQTPGGEAQRLAEETDLRANYSTPCIDQ